MAAEDHRSPETTTAAVIQATHRKPVRDHEPDRSMLAARASVPTTPQTSAVRDPDIHNPQPVDPKCQSGKERVRWSGAEGRQGDDGHRPRPAPRARRTTFASSIVAVARRREAQAGVLMNSMSMTPCAMATTLATVTPIQSACPTGGVLDGVKLRVSSHSSHKSPVRCTSVVWRIQATTCGAESPAHELMAATSVTTRMSKPSSRATSTGQASDTVSAHPPRSRPQTLGSSHRDHETPWQRKSDDRREPHGFARGTADSSQSGQQDRHHRGEKEHDSGSALVPSDTANPSPRRKPRPLTAVLASRPREPRRAGWWRPGESRGWWRPC